MQEQPKKLTFENFHEIYKKNSQQKLLQQAMVYLKLRQHGCPKTKALIFAKKKEQGTDGTVTKDGPAGFRKLNPQKPQGKLVNGWLKGQKLKYKGLRGFSQQIRRNVSKQKAMITSYNQGFRSEFQQNRLKQKQKGVLQSLMESGQTKKVLQHIGSLKDQFLKDRQKRNLFLSYEGFRLDQYTRNYFDKVEEQNAQSLIVKLGAFEGPINDKNFEIQIDEEIAKGRSLSSYQIQGQKKRKSVLDFRKSMSSLSLPSTEGSKSSKKFRMTLQASNKKLIASSLNKFSKVRSPAREQKQFEEFYNDIDKLIWLKTRKDDTKQSAQSLKI